MRKQEMQYLDVDYMTQIENMKSEIRYLFFCCVLMFLTSCLFFCLYHFQNKRLVQVELKMEIFGEPTNEKPLMCGL